MLVPLMTFTSSNIGVVSDRQGKDGKGKDGKGKGELDSHA